MFVLLALASLTAQAPPPPCAAAEPESRFARMDRDRNGFITVNEAPRVSLTRGESASPAGGAAWIASYDSDGDARVSEREYVESVAAAVVRASLQTGAMRD